MFFSCHFRVSECIHTLVVWMLRNSLLEASLKSEGEVTATGVERRTTYFLNEHSAIWPNWPDDRAVFWVLIFTEHLIVCSCHVTHVCQSESTLYSCLNVKQLIAKSRRDICRRTYCNWIQTQNHVVLKGTINHLVKLARWLSCFLSNYIYSVFDCTFMSRMCFRVNPHSIVVWMSRNSLLKAGAKFEVEVITTGPEPRTIYFLSEHSTIWSNWSVDRAVLNTYLYSVFDFLFLPCYVRVSEWIHGVYLSKCQGTPCSKQGRSLKVKWLLLNSNQEPLTC